MKYSKLLAFKKAFTSFTPLRINKKKGFRLDRNIIAEVI